MFTGRITLQWFRTIFVLVLVTPSTPRTKWAEQLLHRSSKWHFRLSPEREKERERESRSVVAQSVNTFANGQNIHLREDLLLYMFAFVCICLPRYFQSHHGASTFASSPGCTSQAWPRVLRVAIWVLAPVLVPSSKALVSNSFLLLLVRHLLLEAMHLLLVTFLFLVVRPGATSSVLATSSNALCY